MSVRNALVVSSADDARPSKATKVQQLRRLADLMEVEARIESEWKAIIAEVHSLSCALSFKLLYNSRIYR